MVPQRSERGPGLGYHVVEADSYEQAMERLKECPHLDYRGTIELREIDNMGR